MPESGRDHRKMHPLRGPGRGALLTGIVFLVFLTGLSGCRNGSQKAEEIRLGLIASLSGEMAQSGTSASQAARLKVKAVNSSGGLLLGGRKYVLKLLVEDDRDNPQTAVAAAQKLINQKGIAALIGPMASRNAIPVARVAEKAFVPMISPVSTHPDTTAGKNYVFRAAATDSFQGKVLGEFAFNDLGMTRAAVLFDAAGAYNQTLAKVFRSEFRALGGEVTGFEFYTTGEEDFRDQLRRIGRSEPDLLFLPNYPPDVVRQVEQARELGLTCLILGSDGWGTMSAEGFAAVGEAYFSNLWAPDPADDRNRVFIEAYQKAYDRSPDSLAALTYDSVSLLVEAIKSQGRADSRAIREGLAQTRDFQGLAGSISYEKGGDPIKSVAIMALREGKPVFFKSFAPD